MKTNIEKNMWAQTKGNDIITNVISANQHFALTFRCRFSNSRDIVASSPSSSCPEASLGKPKSCWLLLSNIRKSQGLNFCTKTIITINLLIHLSLVSLISNYSLRKECWVTKQTKATWKRRVEVPYLNSNGSVLPIVCGPCPGYVQTMLTSDKGV